MKHLVLLLTVILSLSFTLTTFAQDNYSPWTASLSTNAVNNPVRKLPGEEGKFQTWNMDPAGFKLALARHLKNKISFEALVSLNSIKQEHTNRDEKFPYISIDGMFKYKLINNITFNPYVSLGGGYTWLDEIGAGTVNGAVGIDFWLTYNFGFTAQSAYKHAFEDYGLSHYQHSAGIIFKFGGADNDNDGIFNQEDECPDTFGLAKFNGCPDTDKDGIPDKEDNCPETPGTNNGCPDQDNDGVADLYDRCPTIAGDISNKGCPLPDYDKDGVPDKYDKCPKLQGTENGCPKKEIKNAYSKEELKNLKPIVIYFELSKAEIRPSEIKKLENIAQLISKGKFKKYLISGHTDNTATEETNLKLSFERANTVKNYLLNKGINAESLIVKGFGEQYPVDTSNTEEGRVKNRRVEVIPVE
ncbi:OmpA family protein [Mesoflavibacter sp.]|uniref:OmpA family protein n=1 Tax=Mesoflavibacter TaxID=444051 RepID=UPI0035165E77